MSDSPKTDNPAQAPAPAGDTSAGVGYCRPPKHTQFVKGRSGNPKGRPRKDKTASATERVFNDICGRATVRGRERSITGREAIYRGLLKAALEGNVKAAEAILMEEIRLLNEVAGQVADNRRTKPRKRSGQHGKSGFMIIWSKPTLDAWEAAAMAQQQRLVEDTRSTQ